MPARRLSPFQILAEPVRLYLIELLCWGPASSGDLALMVFDRFQVGWSAVSRHLGTLRASGFVRLIRHDPQRWYALRDDWLDLIDEPVGGLHRAWEEGDPYRALGDMDLADETSKNWGLPLVSIPGRRGMRGRARVNTADRGIGRSEESDDADGGAGFD